MQETREPRFRFAPVSGAPSGLIDVAAGYFFLSSILSAFVIVAGLLSGPGAVDETAGVFVARIVLWLAAALGQFWVGLQFLRRRLVAGKIALVLVLLPLPFKHDLSTVVFAVLGLIVLKAIWRDLRPDSDIFTRRGTV